MDECPALAAGREGNRSTVAQDRHDRRLHDSEESHFNGVVTASHRHQGISYCATCDAKYHEGKHVIVIGGGNSAIEEALFIAKFASKITVVL
jgi:hypothetical protein